MYCFFFKQKTAYEMRISDWSSDVCSSDLGHDGQAEEKNARDFARGEGEEEHARQRQAPGDDHHIRSLPPQRASGQAVAYHPRQSAPDEAADRYRAARDESASRGEHGEFTDVEGGRPGAERGAVAGREYVDQIDRPDERAIPAGEAPETG